MCSSNWLFSLCFSAMSLAFNSICNDVKKKKSVWQQYCPHCPHNILYTLTLPYDYSCQPPSLWLPVYSLLGWWGGIFVCCCSWHTPPPPPPCLSVGTWKAVWGASANLPNLLHFIHSWGNLPGSEKASFSVYEMLMWLASALPCAWEHRGPLVVVKPTCSVCFSMCEMAKHAKLPQPEFRQTWKRTKCRGWYEYICILNLPCVFSSCSIWQRIPKAIKKSPLQVVLKWFVSSFINRLTGNVSPFFTID